MLNIDTSQLDTKIQYLTEKIDKVESLLSDFVNQKVGKNSALLTNNEVTEIFHVTKCTLWNWERAGHITPVRIGRSVYYKESDIQALYNSKLDKHSSKQKAS